tara:strand:- start:240 stop:695 length:456 start_codon:yes stop_codon:yes gene_type:complete
MTDSLDSKTLGGVWYRKLRPIHKYQVQSTALFEFEPRHRLDLGNGLYQAARITSDFTGVPLVLIRPDHAWIYPSYCWDGPSGPAIDTEDFLDGSLIHDALCQAIDLGLIDRKNQRKADGIMRRVNRSNGMGKFRAWYSWASVRAYRAYKTK